MDTPIEIDLTEVLGLDQAVDLILSSVLEVCGNYRAHAIERGFSEEAAEEMAVTLHGVAVTRIFVGSMAVVS
jgi:hypothetical protein